MCGGRLCAVQPAHNQRAGSSAPIHCFSISFLMAWLRNAVTLSPNHHLVAPPPGPRQTPQHPTSTHGPDSTSRCPPYPHRPAPSRIPSATVSPGSRDSTQRTRPPRRDRGQPPGPIRHVSKLGDTDTRSAFSSASGPGGKSRGPAISANGLPIRCPQFGGRRFEGDKTAAFLEDSVSQDLGHRMHEKRK